MFNALHHRYKSAFFELIVARTLQILGAEIKVEPKQDDNKQPDFRAQFPDRTIIVEAACPNFNAEAGEGIKNRNPLTDIIEDLLPEGWNVGVWNLPEIGLADSKKAFRRTVTGMLSIPPPTDETTELDLAEELPSGIVHLRLVPRRQNWPATTWALASFDHTKETLRKVMGKEAQAGS